MKLIMEDAPRLKSAVDSIASLVEEGIFEVRKDGLHLKAMDPSQISMVSFTLPKAAFVEYEVDEETKLALDIAQLSSVLARGKKGERAELTTEEGRFVIKFYTGKRKRTFKIPLLTIGEGLQREPKIEFKNFVRIHAETLKDVLRDAKLVSSHVRFLFDPDKFIVEVKGDNGDVRAEFEKDGEEILELKSPVAIRATFPLQYLEDIVRASSAAAPITVYLETDRPMKLEYDVEGAKVIYYLAPRIESE
ncbi:MAG TPA: proliferating cell nuclear antigen (pcna) [Candidatus Bilamarchaeaceae archaeon]|nr:proliferating cell nuclear antigen (pcna) [Candidatus Bilamarchaeaceae archaeon]